MSRPSLSTMGSLGSFKISNGKRWVPDEEVHSCPICAKKLESSMLDLTVSGKTHCRYCGGVFCTSCCTKELFMPDDEIAKPDYVQGGASLVKSMMVSASEKHKACNNCAQILEPQQAAIRAAKAKKADPVAVAVAKSVPEPYYAISVVGAKDLMNGATGAGAVFCQLSVGSSILNTATSTAAAPRWGASLDFAVAAEGGNTLQIRCYRESAGGNELLGDAALPLAECGETWVKLSPAGEVLISVSFSCHREPKALPTRLPSASAIAAPLPTAAVPARRPAAPAAASPIVANGGSLVYLQEHAWLIYVAFLVAVIAYKFMAMGGVGRFGGESIPLRPGATLGNDKWLSSGTHFLHMQKDGNLVLARGASPKEMLGVEWESGKPYAKRDCAKCVAALDKDGALLHVKEGKSPIRTVNIAADPWLTAAIGTKKA